MLAPQSSLSESFRSHSTGLRPKILRKFKRFDGDVGVFVLLPDYERSENSGMASRASVAVRYSAIEFW